MILKSIQLENFRNYLKAIFYFNKNKNIIWGKNGTGKSSLIEAIYIISNLKSYRSPDYYLPNFNSDFFFVKGEIYSDEILTTVEISYSKKDRRKKVKKDASEIKNFSKFVGTLKTVLFLPQDLSYIEGTPEIKRNFMDTLFCQIDTEYAVTLNKLNKIIQSRNFVLRENIENKLENIKILDQSLIKYGSIIIWKRKNYIEEFYKFFIDELKKIGIRLEHNIKIKYINDVVKENESISLENIREEYEKKLNESFQNDIKFGYTTCGPHHDNLIFELDNFFDASEIFSTGEKRTLAIILKFAEFYFIKSKTLKSPLILMDDVFLELDENNFSLVIDFINSNCDAQFFLTTLNLKGYDKIEDKEIIYLDGKDK